MTSVYTSIRLKKFMYYPPTLRPKSIEICIYPGYNQPPVKYNITRMDLRNLNIMQSSVHIGNIIEVKIDGNSLGLRSILSKDSTLEYRKGKSKYSLTYTCYP